MTEQLIAGRYALGDVLGEGGMGSVLRARDVRTNRQVAVKLMRKHLLADTASVRRFEREMHVMMLIEHPNTVRLYDFGRTEDDELFLVMELVQGRALADELLVHGPLPIERVVRIGAHVARALAAVHAQGIVHRDLKPGNIMLRDLHGERDWALVLDFGIAALANSARVTEVGMVAGSPAYCSPEQALGTGPGTASDLYMLGVVLYEMLAGRLPFSADSHHGYLYAHVNTAPTAIAELRPDAPLWLSRLVMELLAKDPTQRPAAEHVLEGLVGRVFTSATDAPVMVDRGAQTAVVQRSTSLVATPERRRSGFVWVSALGLVVGVGAIVFVGMRDSPERDPPRLARHDEGDAETAAAPLILTEPVLAETPTTVDAITATHDVAPPTEAVEVTPAGDVVASDPDEARDPDPMPMASLYVSTTPSGATVKFGGRVATSPVRLQCQVGRRVTVDISKRQYIPVTRTITCGKERSLTVTLSEP